MFLCKVCHDKQETNHKFETHLARSYGPCEVCHKGRECVDCKE